MIGGRSMTRIYLVTNLMCYADPCFHANYYLLKQKVLSCYRNNKTLTVKLYWGLAGITHLDTHHLCNQLCKCSNPGPSTLAWTARSLSLTSAGPVNERDINVTRPQDQPACPEPSHWQTPSTCLLSPLIGLLHMEPFLEDTVHLNQSDLLKESDW